MAVIKRKEAPIAKANGANSSKKAKTEEKQLKQHARLPRRQLETEPDSDPISESDTASQSGDDDGASWPSGDDDDLGEVDQQAQEKKPQQAKTVDGKSKFKNPTESKGSGEAKTPADVVECTALYVSSASSSKLTAIFSFGIEGISRQTEGSCAGEKGCKAKCRLNRSF